MAITNDNFDQLKIDKLKYFLEDMAQKNQPRPYEIFVDTLKVVPKTEDLGAAMLGRLAEKHAGALEQLGLAGLAAPALQAPAIADEKASFSKKRPPAPDTAQHHYTHILQQLESVFAEQDLIVVMDILHRFAQQPEQLKTVADLLDITVK